MIRLLKKAVEVLATDPVNGMPLDTIGRFHLACSLATAFTLAAICLSLALSLKEF